MESLKQIMLLIHLRFGCLVCLWGTCIIYSEHKFRLTFLNSPNGAHLRGVYSNIESFRYQDDVGEGMDLKYFC